MRNSSGNPTTIIEETFWAFFLTESYWISYSALSVMQTCNRSPALIKGAFDWSYSGVRRRKKFCHKSLLPWFLDHLIRVIYRFSRGKSKTLFNIYSLFKQNLQWCNAKETVKTTRTVKNNNFARAEHCFIVHFFAVVSPFVLVAMRYIYF